MCVSHQLMMSSTFSVFIPPIAAIVPSFPLPLVAPTVTPAATWRFQTSVR